MKEITPDTLQTLLQARIDAVEPYVFGRAQGISEHEQMALGAVLFEVLCIARHFGLTVQTRAPIKSLPVNYPARSEKRS